MNRLLLIPLFFLALTINAQKSEYFPFPETNTIWNFASNIPGIPIEFRYSIIMATDTIINDVTYHVLITPFINPSPNENLFGYKGAIRQDFEQRKVYIIPPHESTEQLLYDFNLQTGDSLYGYLYPGLYRDHVIEIDTVMVGNIYHNRWFINEEHQIYLIEGVGLTYGLIEQSPGLQPDATEYSMTCFRQNDITLYPDTLTECDVITSIIKMTDEGDVSVLPNPFHGSFNIKLSHPRDIAEIRIIDITGKIIQTERVLNREDISIYSLSPGAYVLQVISNVRSIRNLNLVSY